jgi:ABC-type sugar transport system permease subunit
MFAGNIPVAIMHSILFGSQVGWGFLWGLYGLPWVLAGTLVGLAAGNSISKQRLRRVTLVVLALIGIQATVWPCFVDRPAEKKSNSGQPAAPAAGASAKEL